MIIFMKKAHFIGICGKGMSGVAVMLKEAGWEISGSDSGFYDPIASYLKNVGIDFAGEHKEENIPEGVDLIVIGKHAKLVPEENEEVRAAFDSGIPIKSFPEVLADLSKGTENIVVVGSYGKSTITSLLSYCLVDAKKDPSYFIGAVPLDLSTNSHKGDGKYFVLEGDEYPSSNWDTRAKFMHYNPRIVLLSSGEHDHINVFPTLEDYHKPYLELMDIIPKDGHLFICVDNPYTEEIARATHAPVTKYSFDKDYCWHAKNIEYDKNTKFDIYDEEKFVGKFETRLLGDHNIQNIIGVVALLSSENILTIPELQKSIANFRGIIGRLDLKSEKSRVPVYEIYGSSYPKTKSALSALKKHFPEKEIIIVFDPHTFSWRNREALPWYKDVFEGCASILIYPPPTHGQNSHEQLSHDEIMDVVKESYPDSKVYKIVDADEALKILKDIAGDNSIIAISTSGGMGGLPASVPKLFE